MHFQEALFLYPQIATSSPFTGTGNVLKVQNLLHICSEHFDTDKKKEEKEKDPKAKKDDKSEKKEDTKEPDGSHQGVAVLGIAALAMGEDIGMDMALRSFNHLVSFKSRYIYFAK